MSNEIWCPDLHDRDFTLGAEGGLGPKGKVTLSSRFNRLASGYTNPDRPLAVLAAGLESGQLELWDPAQITDRTDVPSARLLRNAIHTGPVRAPHFNPSKHPSSRLVASAANSIPGISIARKILLLTLPVAHILASSSLSGYTVVWDLRGKRKVVALQYGGGGGPVGGPGPGSGAGGVRRGVSDVAWHPENATRLITASEDDSQSVIVLWDLHNARAPERILQGHERGAPSITAPWYETPAREKSLTSSPLEIIGPSSLPGTRATPIYSQLPANYGGSIALHSIQSIVPTSTTTTAPKAPANPNGVFDPANFADTADAQNLGSSVNLECAPKWLKPPAGARFGFGGVLVEVTNTGAEDEKEHGKVQIKHVVGESELVKRAKELIKTEEEEGGIKAFVESRAGKANPKDGSEETVAEAAKESKDTYSTLLALFNSDPESASIKLVGYDASPAALDEALAVVRAKTYDSVVSFATETTHVPHSPVRKAKDDDEASGNTDVPGTAPSEVGAFRSDAKQVDTASTTTEPSLFSDEPVGAGPGPAAGDFSNTLASDNDALPTRPRAALVPHLS
ncbi:Protein transport protein SEC31 OS=Ustilago maydis (strain 521 / FGSC 9021) GN=SEC31 PE=3 SV=1 [Rhizoctonia solani AG-1 IB]|uniref:Protein transport protein SEC31 n=1 Tax=Thanatephorus cucumeris (strain AG1-IB / isolate 7/3/14) TaxID=1108050 RepID=A0A0B7F5J6_THACB|nr:Protein transport protein SEC31 OS=Ustilago maydis (strain 521 / FGSC 9021) GN=SEC31 PE=3 SV=1 [Rhizoctonia solani AG-1 IB]